jgi:hypothetical protein
MTDSYAGNWLTVTDWTSALASGWKIEGPVGRWEVQGGVLRLHVDDGDAGRWLELALAGDLGLSSDFALEIAFRFLSVGLVQNSTDEASRLVIELGTGSSLDLGMRVELVGDWYMVDVDRFPQQNLLLRSVEGEWYRWRFEVRTARRQVALVRDGEYICLHTVQVRRPAGLRVQVRGTAEAPTTVELGEVRLLPLPAEPEEMEPAPRPRETILPGEWPMFRRDRVNSGNSPLVGALGQSPPAVVWSYPLGGWGSDVYMVDCDGDGGDEILIAFNGSLAAYRPDGVLLWKRCIDSPMMYSVYDLDADDRLELVILAGTPSHVEVLDGATGQTRYVCSHDPEYDVWGLRVGKLDPERRGLQMVVWTRHEIGYCLGFEGGAEHGHVLWTFDYQHTGFGPAVALADMDQDDLLEVVLVTYNHFFVYDGRSGAVKMSLEANVGRNYGRLIVQDINGDGYPDLVMLADDLREHVCVVRNEGGQSLRLLWDKFYEQDYPVDQKELRTLPGSVGDWDGDGRVEILCGLYDETDGDMWRTLLVDALTGERKIVLNGYYPVTMETLPRGVWVAYLAEITGRGKRHEVVHGTGTRSVREFVKALKAFSFQGGKPNLLAELPGGSPLLDHSWRAFPATEWATYEDARTLRRRSGEHGVYLVDSQGDEDAALVVRHVQVGADGARRETWRGTLSRNLPAGRLLNVGENFPSIAGQAGGVGLSLLYAGLDATLYLLDERGQILRTFPGGGMIGYPVVADLGDQLRLCVLVNDGCERLLCLAPGEDSGAPVLEWQVPAIGNDRPLFAEQGMGAPLALDWNHDGAKEVLVGQPPRQLSILDAGGHVQWRCGLPAKPTYLTYGNFTGREAFDLFVAYASALYEGGCRVLRPSDGETLVWRCNYGNYVPAVWDFDGDGRDDLVRRDMLWRRTVDGATGRDLFPLTEWACCHSAHMPIIVEDPKFEGGAIVLWTGGWNSLVAETPDGYRLWWKPVPISLRHAGAVADVDGDGRLEIGTPTWGEAYNCLTTVTWEPLPGPGLGRAFVCLDLATGEVKWTYDPGVAMSSVVTADVDSDGLPEFLFGTADGRLLALRGGADESRRVVFSVQLPAALGMPIVCDPIGEGRMHILVGCADGNLYALR